MYLDSSSVYRSTLTGCLFYFFFLSDPALVVVLWLVAKARPGAIYQNNLLSEGNLLLTDKSLPSVGCNGSHLSSFSEYCPSRLPQTQTQLCEGSPFPPSCLKVQQLLHATVMVLRTFWRWGTSFVHIWAQHRAASVTVVVFCVYWATCGWKTLQLH